MHNQQAMSYDLLSSQPAAVSLRAGPADRLDRFLLRAVDLSLAGCIFVVPFLMGGRQALGQLVLVASAALAATAWLLRQSLRGRGVWRRTGGEWIFLAGSALVLVQLAWLPPGALGWLSPQTARLLPLWADGGEATARLGAWSQVSLTPAATRDGFGLFLAYAMLFLVAVQRIRCVEDAERLLRWCALAALAMGAFGVVQYVTSNGKFFWVYEHPFSTTADVAKGSFTCRNHFAQFLALGIGPLVWWVQHEARAPRRRKDRDAGRAATFAAFALGNTLRVIALGIVLFAGLLSLSRGGMVAMLLAAAIAATVAYRASSLGFRFLAGLGAVGLLIAAALTVYGYEQVARRVDNLASASIEKMDQTGSRRTIWEAVIKAIPDYPILGAGVGSHQHVYPMYVERADDWLYYTHAENSPLQVALETGLVGLGVAAAAVLMCVWWCVSGLRRASSKRVMVGVGAVAASLAANLVHSLVDFTWYVPACMALVALLAACACRLRQLSGSEAEQAQAKVALARPVAWAFTLGVAVLGLWMTGQRVGPAVAERSWFQFLRLARTSVDDLKAVSDEASQAGEPDPLAPFWQAREGRNRKMAAALEDVLRFNPCHAEAHLRLAETYLDLFECLQQGGVNVMPLRAISDTVMSEQFASPSALREWLVRAVGEHARLLDLAAQHARRGLTLGPLAGEGYVYLGELCFLEGGNRATKAAYLDQALRVRPFNGRVLFDAGKEALVAGDLKRWQALWQRAFRTGKIYQKQIIEGLAGRIRPDNPAQEIEFLLETFQPDRHGLAVMHRVYGEALAVPEEHLFALKRRYAEALEAEAGSTRDKPTAALWAEAMQLHYQLGDTERSVQCGRNALACDPNDYPTHLQFAKCMEAQGQWAEAEEHLRWCLTRRPERTHLENRLRHVIMARIDAEGRGLQASRPTTERR